MTWGMVRSALGRTRSAIRHNVSLRCVGPYVPGAAGPVARGAGAGALRTRLETDGAGVAGVEAADEATGVLTTGAGACMSTGGSTSNVYSRTICPEPQLASTRKSRKGSFTGTLLVTWMTALPSGRFSTRNRSLLWKWARGMPALA